MKKFLFGILLMVIAAVGYSKELAQPLRPEQAFTFSAQLSKPNQLILQWKIAPGYYLYSSQLQLYDDQAKIIPLPLPKGLPEHDNFHGVDQHYIDTLKVEVPLTPANQGSTAFTIKYQGCSTNDFCYSPVKKDFRFNSTPPATAQFITAATPIPPEQTYSEQTDVEKLFSRHGPFIMVLSFLGLGLLLAFTPCVLPMVPILYSIIIGHRKKNPSTAKAFSLSLAYVLGMAITYAIAGMVVALLGNHIQTGLQKPWIIALFSGIFILMALSLFGLYEFRLPSRWQKSLTQLSNQQKGGTYFGVFLMGSLSTLIISPCISPALVGVLAYIAHTGNMWLGAAALLSLGIGMGLPLLVVGASITKFLPKTGAWMQTIEHLVGIMMLGFAIWLLARIIPGPLALLLWSALLIISAVVMGDFAKAFTRWHLLRHSLAIIALIYGIILLAGAALGNTDPLHPWENWHFTSQTKSLPAQPLFTTVNSMTQFNQALATAKKDGGWVILDFYADWCEVCVHMDRYLFTKQNVKQALSSFILLRANITADNTFDNAIMDRYKVIAPPTLLFFTPDGKELTNDRLIGDTADDELITQIQELKEKTSGHP